MCTFNFWGQMTKCARAAFSFALCFLSVGLALIIAGIVLLTWPNTRDANIAAYHDQAAIYNGSDQRVWPRVSGIVNGNGSRIMTLINQSEYVVGDKDGVKDVYHYSLSATTLLQSASDTYSIVLSVAANNTQSAAAFSVLSVTIPYIQMTSVAMKCTRKQCTNGCTSKSGSSYCSGWKMESYCNEYFAGTYSSLYAGCSSKDESCGTCTYPAQLSGACIVVTFGANNVITRSSKYTSCYYPFTNFKYAPSSPSFTLSILSDQDPFLTLQQRTSGSMDFGSSGAHQKIIAAGIAVLVVGAVLTLGCGAGSACMVKCHSASPAQQPSAFPQGSSPGPEDNPMQAESELVHVQPPVCVVGRPVAPNAHDNPMNDPCVYGYPQQVPFGYGWDSDYNQRPTYYGYPPALGPSSAYDDEREHAYGYGQQPGQVHSQQLLANGSTAA